jgi:hypothetical protein
VIDLEKNPGVMIEILRQFGQRFDPEPGDGSVAPGGAGGVSSVAIAGTHLDEVRLDEILKVLFELRKEVRGIGELRKEVRGIAATVDKLAARKQ